MKSRKDVEASAGGDGSAGKVRGRKKLEMGGGDSGGRRVRVEEGAGVSGRYFGLG